MKSFEAKGIQKSFGAVIALRDASVGFEGPQVCGLVGANGSGKTTFAKICCGLYEPDCGDIAIDGKQVKIDSPFDAAKRGIVLAHQNLSLAPDLTVWENIALGHETGKRMFFLDNDKARSDAQAILDDLIPGEILLDTKVESLSPAHKQMVEIAKAISQDPKLLILDEPTAALEYFHVEQLFKKIEELKADGISIIFISHRLWEITRICDLVFAFRNGEYIDTVDFSKQPRNNDLIVPLIIGEDTDRVISFDRKKQKSFEREEISISLDDVSDGKKLHNISFTAKKGEILGIGGLNGQGQEELINLMAGAMPATSGRILLEGKEINLRHPKDAVKRGIYLVPGDRNVEGLFRTHTILHNIAFPRYPLKREKSFLDYKRLTDISDNIIERMEIHPPNRNMTIDKLSGGNQQKVVFGRWLQFDPAVLLLNDPAKGIDIQAKDSLYTLTHELAAKGTTIILYSSGNEELISNCDRVLVMFEGRIVDELDYDDITDDNLVKSSLRVEADSEQ
jgi:ribose transport system ATP-binding protein